MAIKEIHYGEDMVPYKYDEAAPWTALDQELVDAMVAEVDKDQRYEAEVKALTDRGAELAAKVDKLRERGTEVRALMRKAQTTATEFAGMLRLGRNDMAEAFAQAVNTASDALHERHEEISAVHNLYEALCNDHKELIERTDLEGEEDAERMHHLIVKACKTQKDLATDAVTYDVAHEDLMDIIAEHDDHRKDMLQYVLDTLKEYELVQETARGQQEVWEEFCERLKMIELMGHDKGGVVQVGMN